MGKSKAPAPPNPKETSAAATSTNVGTAIANSWLNNVNQVTPDGTISYEQTGTKSWYDPYTGKTYQIPVTTATTKLSEAQQGIYDTNMITEKNLANIGRDQSAKIGGLLGTNLDLSADNVRGYINDHFADDFNKTWDQNQSSLETRLANQGIRMGSAAYDRAISDYSTQRSSAYDNMYGNQWDRATQNILTERNQPLNEISALLSGTQVSQPTPAGYNTSPIANTDVAGLINANYQQRLAAWQTQQEQAGGVLGGLFGLGAAAIKYSDKRLKTDIEKIGETDDGQPLYAYRYKSGGPMQIGLMAQEVAKKHPDAVIDTPSGFKAVDYSKALSLGA